jgi:Phycobilisome protein
MNHTLLASIQQSDGRYLSDSELRPLAQFVASFDTRLKTYTRLKEDGEGLVLKALRQLMMGSHREAAQEHGAKCQRDMLYTLECIAKAVLLDNPDGFIEEYVVWMQNITRALHKEDSAIAAYRHLQTEILAALPEASAQLVNGYLDKLIQAFSDGL